MWLVLSGSAAPPTWKDRRSSAGVQCTMDEAVYPDEWTLRSRRGVSDPPATRRPHHVHCAVERPSACPIRRLLSDSPRAHVARATAPILARADPRDGRKHRKQRRRQRQRTA